MSRRRDPKKAGPTFRKVVLVCTNEGQHDPYTLRVYRVGQDGDVVRADSAAERAFAVADSEAEVEAMLLQKLRATGLDQPENRDRMVCGRCPRTPTYVDVISTVRSVASLAAGPKVTYDTSTGATLPEQ